MGSWIRSDTDGILDKCSECGAFAGYRPSVNGDGPMWSVACTDCSEQTDYFSSKFDAAIAWNLTQRENISKQRIS